MYAPERQQRIPQEARNEGRGEVAGPAATLKVTSETIRRDLTALKRDGPLRRVHGGAIPLDRLGFEPGPKNAWRLAPARLQGTSDGP